MENHHFNGKIYYKWPFSIAMLVYQRVDLETFCGMDGFTHYTISITNEKQ
jgi:hypothetical protein